MDDLVVIILTLIIAVAGVIGQSKKKKQIASGSTAENKKKDFWDLLKEDPFRDADFKPEPEYIEAEEPEAEPYENEQDYKFYSNREGGKLIQEPPQVQQPPEPVIQKQRKNFSLRKAVIYSEILNRKYF